MRISDWSSDVCSSDLRADGAVRVLAFEPDAHRRALGVDQPRRLRPADQGDVVARHQQLGAEQRAIGCAEDVDLPCHATLPACFGSVPAGAARSEGRSVGKECVSTWIARWWPYRQKKK